LKKDENGNILNGNILTRETQGCLVMGGRRLVVTNHIRDTVVIDTPDSVFVSNMENSRDVKFIVKKLKEEGRKESHHHQTRMLPWGSRTFFEECADFYFSRIDILPQKTYSVAPKKGWAKRIVLVSGSGRLRQKPGKDVLLQDPVQGCIAISGRVAVCNTSETNLRIIEIGTHDNFK